MEHCLARSSISGQSAPHEAVLGSGLACFLWLAQLRLRELLAVRDRRYLGRSDSLRSIGCNVTDYPPQPMQAVGLSIHRRVASQDQTRRPRFYSSAPPRFRSEYCAKVAWLPMVRRSRRASAS